MTTSDNSREANARIRPKAQTLRARVLALIAGAGSRGMTDYEIQQATGLRNNTQTPRRRELVQSGAIVDSGTKRKTGSGCKATVWVLPQFGPDMQAPPPDDCEQGLLFGDMTPEREHIH